MPTSAATPMHNEPNTLANFRVRQSGAALGAQVLGVDLAQPIPADVADAILEAWHQNLVLLFRDQTMNPQQYLAAANVFGAPQVGANRAYYANVGKANPYEAPDFPEITLMSNLGPDGEPVQSNQGLGSEEVVWHSDNSYIEQPPAGSTLFALEIPDDDSGKTSFSNQYMALADLPAELRVAIAGRCSKQDATRNSAGVLRPGVQMPTTPAEVPGPLHPLVRIHPDTGRAALYLGRRRAYPSQYIEGYADAESEALLNKLWAHATQPRYTWTHNWRVGDLLIWDNRASMHYRELVNNTQARVLWRSQFQGETVTPA
jgi:taurine dioxygenase